MEQLSLTPKSLSPVSHRGGVWIREVKERLEGRENHTDIKNRGDTDSFTNRDLQLGSLATTGKKKCMGLTLRIIQYKY